MQLHAITLADVLMHLGIGGIFLCTSACTQRFCRHKILRYTILGAAAIGEAVFITAVAG